jgi:hypothetical protein
VFVGSYWWAAVAAGNYWFVVEAAGNYCSLCSALVRHKTKRKQELDFFRLFLHTDQTVAADHAVLLLHFDQTVAAVLAVLVLPDS